MLPFYQLSIDVFAVYSKRMFIIFVEFCPFWVYGLITHWFSASYEGDKNCALKKFLGLLSPAKMRFCPLVHFCYIYNIYIATHTEQRTQKNVPTLCRAGTLRDDPRVWLFDVDFYRFSAMWADEICACIIISKKNGQRYANNACNLLQFAQGRVSRNDLRNSSLRNSFISVFVGHLCCKLFHCPTMLSYIVF